MQINFLDYAQCVPSVDEFGICDIDDGTGKRPAFISTNKAADKWGVAVSYSIFRHDYRFIAVDNNIPLKKILDGKEETASTCDAMLCTAQTVCFIELKDQRQEWLSDAIGQLQNTIDFFKRLNAKEWNRCTYKKAYACNVAVNRFAVSFKNAMQGFYKNNRAVLRIVLGHRDGIEELK